MAVTTRTRHHQRPGPLGHRGAYACLLPLLLLASLDAAEGPGLPTATWPAGTLIDELPDDGGRAGFFHRGYYFLQSKRTGGDNVVLDLSAGTLRVARRLNGGDNMHRWWRIGDWVRGDIGNLTQIREAAGSSEWLDVSDMLAPVPASGSGPLPLDSDRPETFPHSFGFGMRDMRTGEWYTRRNLFDESGVAAKKTARIGDLVFQVPQGAQTGVAVWDVGDPREPRLLDTLGTAYKQYTGAVHFWRHYLVLLSGGDDDNGPNNENLVVIDCSDPTDLRYAWGMKSADCTPGRYIKFQDEYGFVGAGPRRGGRKIDMRTGTVVLEYPSPGDFWHQPLGHLVVASTGQNSFDRTYLLAHQGELDRRPPTVGWHWPQPDTTDLPVTTNVGLVINEVLDGLTVDDTTIRLAPLGGDPVATDILLSDYNVVQIAPREPLADDTTYEVTIVGDSVRDVAGNAMAAWSFRFSTGSSIGGGGISTVPTITSLEVAGGTPQVAGSTTISAEADDADGDPLSYRFDFGDGSAPTAWGPTNTVSHTFAPGVQQVQVQVRDDDGNVVARTTGLVTYNAALATDARRPVQSSQLAYDAGRDRVWAVNPDNDSITALAVTATPAVVGEFATAAGPTAVTVDGAGRIWVACRDADVVAVHDGGDGGLLGQVTLPYGAAPVAVLADPIDAEVVYAVETGSGSLARLDTGSLTVIDRLPLGPQPHAIAATATGDRLLVSRRISPDSGGRIWQIDPQAWTRLGTITLPPDTTTEDSTVAARGLPNYLTSVAIHPASGRAWYVAKKDNIFRGPVRDGQALTFETTVRALLGQIDPAAGSETSGARLDIDNHGQPSAVTCAPLGTHVLATMQGNNRLLVLDAHHGATIAEIPTGLAPQAVLVLPGSERVVVKNFTGRSVTVIDATAVLQAAGNTATVLATLPTVTTEALDATVLRGKQVFYNAADERMTEDGYLSCASCHDDGGYDGRTWDFTDRGEGLRNTTTLRGRRGLGHGRVHWTANFDEIQDFEHDIRQNFGGTGFLSAADFAATDHPLGAEKAGRDADLDALAAYVGSLTDHPRSPHRLADGSATAAGQRGRDVFIKLNCQSCHGGEDYTDSAAGILHDVGSIGPASGQRLGGLLTGIDTPTLRGAWRTPPYLHDGSAADFAGVFAAAPADSVHSLVQDLGDADRADLIAFLRELDGNEASVPDGSRQIRITITPAHSGIIDLQVSPDHVDRVIDDGASQTVAGLSPRLPYLIGIDIQPDTVGRRSTGY